MGKFKCESCGNEMEADTAPEHCGAPMKEAVAEAAPQEAGSEAPAAGAEGGEEKPAESTG